MNRILLLSLLWVVVGPPCCRETPEAFAQPPLPAPKISIVESSAEPITLVESKSFVWEGFANAKIVDGKLIADMTSKPKFAGSTSQILLTLADGYTISEVVAEAVPSMEFADLLEATLPGGATELSFDPDTKPGAYRITVKAQKAGVSRQAIKRLNVVVGGNGPAPPDVDVDNLPATAKAARKVMVDYVQAMAQDMEKMSVDVVKYKTVIESSKAFNDLDLPTRNSFKASIANVMQPRLGSDALPPDAAKVFAEIAIGYRSIK